MDNRDSESQDRVWSLLGKARQAEVRPGFSRDVLEAVRREEEKNSGRWAWVRALWTSGIRPAWVAAAAALVIAGWWLAESRHGGGIATSAPITTISPDAADELADQIASELAMLDDIDALLAPESAQDLGEEDVERVLF
jgi:hypothetical protein